MPRDIETDLKADTRPFAVMAVLLAYLLSRALFYAQPLVGEEGIFAYVLARSPAGPDMCLVGRVAGRELLAPFDHPAGMYALYGAAGALARAFFSAVAPANLDGLAWIRVTHSAFQGVLWLALALAFGNARGPARWALAGWAAVFLSSPLGLGASVTLQTDTSSGTLLAGLAALSLARAAPAAWAWPAAAMFALGAVGKQEWSVAAAAGLALGWTVNRLSGGEGRAWAGLALACGLALLAGNLASFAYDPVNYRGGLRVLSGVAGQHHALHAGQQARWTQVMRLRTPYLGGTLLAMLCASALALSAPAARRGGLIFAASLAWALFLPFALSTWNAEHRYFAPAWAAALAAGAAALSDRHWPGRRLAAGLALAGLLCMSQLNTLARSWSLELSVTEAPGLPLRSYQAALKQAVQAAAAGMDCVPFLPQGAVWRPGGPDFVGDSMGLEGARKLLAPLGRKACT